MEPFIYHAVAALLVYFAAMLYAVRRFTLAPALVVCAGAIAVYLVALIAPLPFMDVAFWPFSALYWFLAMLYIIVFGGLYKSISLRVLRTLLETEGHERAYDDVLQEYLKTEGFSARVGVLVHDGLAEDSGGTLRLTSKGRRMAGAIRAVQRLFNIQVSG